VSDELVPQQGQLVPASPEPVEPETFPQDDILSSPAAFRHAMELATTLSRSQLLPQAFRGKPEDVFMAIMLARKMGEDVFTILSNVHFVNGKPGWSAPFLIARANASGVFDGELSWETTGSGETLAVTCSATLRKDGRRVSKTISMQMAKADGWTRNAKYTSIPEQMLSYRAATFLIRLYCPAILYGLHTTDEWEDVAASRSPARVVYTDPEPVRRRPDPLPEQVPPEPRQTRAYWYERLLQLRQAHGPLVSAAARKLGLRTPRECDTAQLQELCEAVQEALDERATDRPSRDPS
jgi:hypothetical protein